jgi:hypothetical protein
MSNVLEQGLNIRQARIQETRDYLKRTHELFEQFGSQELKTSHAKFDELSKALDSDSQVLLVVIGEFSRGKSSLVNALLDIRLLPTALEATTAINTFVKALPEGKTERFIRIHYQDGRPAKDMEWTDDSVLRKWGTELDTEHSDMRKTLDYIEIFTSHPLLNKGLVLIDTPGLEAVLQHHEEITRRAIAQAHIALWMQDAGQLGGNATEWKFMSETIRKNFRKFITVVNKWDLVLDPTDQHEKEKTEKARVDGKMNTVKKNFKLNFTQQSEAELELLTNKDHLLGVSAGWALGDDPIKKSRSGVDVLAERISDMFSSGEALEQIYLKPLQQLTHIQEQLAATIADELSQLSSTETLEERQRDLEIFDQDIKNLDLEMRTVTAESKSEHERAAKALADAIEKQLVAPLADLKADIEQQVDKRYVEKMMAKKVKKIGLPDELQQSFEKVSQQVASHWAQEKTKMANALEGLRIDYADKMKKHANQLKSGLNKVDISLPTLDVGLEMDFSAIEEYHAKALELEQAVKAREAEIDNIEAEKSMNMTDKAKLDMAQQSVLRAERQIEMLGSQPSPKTGSRRVKVSEGGIWSSPKYEREEYSDYSNVNAWKEQLASQKELLSDKEKRLEQIMHEEQQKTNRRMSLEMAQKKYEKEMASLMRDQAKYEREMANEHANILEETTRKLVNSTAGQLDQRIRYLQDHAKQSIHQIFADQMNLLEACVQEQYLEPLNAKRQKREEVQVLLQQGKTQVAERQAELQKAQDEVGQLLDLTQTALVG